MNVLEDVTEQVMVLAFLQAERHGPRWSEAVCAGLAALNATDAILTDPDLSDEWQNGVRAGILRGIRGYAANAALFRGFPNDVRWRRVSLSLDEIGGLRYANYDTWIRLSGGTRLVSDGAANMDAVEVEENGHSINDGVRAVAQVIDAGEALAEIIGLTLGGTRPIVLLEGHTRATAYRCAVNPPAEVTMILGQSRNMRAWQWYGAP